MNQLEEKIEKRYEHRGHEMHRRPHSANGRVWTGVFLLLIGVAALLKSYLVPGLPEWLFTWQMLLIVLGLFIGLRHNFRGGPWFVLMLVGTVFLLNEYYPNLVDDRIIWPLALIALGAFLILKPRHRERLWQEQKEPANDDLVAAQAEAYPVSGDDFLDSTSVFGGTKKTILSKDFKGGDITNIMGGAEINFTQSDIQGRVVLDVTQIFGGTKIVVPPHWVVKPEMAAIFGGIDDKRTIQSAVIDHNKVLVLKGTSIFVGIEIRSF
ncbi:MAG TPA: LiaF domain-containing protein [Chitinophagaceae bacterium]